MTHNNCLDDSKNELFWKTGPEDLVLQAKKSSFHVFHVLKQMEGSWAGQK